MNTAFETELRKWLSEELIRLRNNLETPGTVQDIADYKHIVGQIFALKRVADALDDINTTINNR